MSLYSSMNLKTNEKKNIVDFLFGYIFFFYLVINLFTFL